MKLHNRNSAGFSTGEMMISVALTSVMFAAALTAMAALQKSFSATDSFFTNHMQQIRIIDYISRDVKRAVAVTTSTDKNTVTCVVPNYVIAANDSEAAASADQEGRRRTPIVTVEIGGPRVDYGRRITDGVTTNNSSVITSANAKFTAADVGSAIWGVGIPSGTTILARNSATSVTISKSARVTAANATVSWARTSTVVYQLSGQSIERKENGTLTTIASSTDQLVPETIDVEQANTEYTTSTVTFMPTFQFGRSNGNAQGQGQSQANPSWKRKGTMVFAKAYLRNRRRG